MSEDYEAICTLKARYFRFMDEKRWDDLRALFADDVVFDVRGAMTPSRLEDTYEEPPIHGAEAATHFLRKALDASVSIHQGYMPEIEMTGPETACGVWAMSDTIGAPDGAPYREIRGAGHYHETYTKRYGTWKIATLRLTRLAVDVR